MSEERLFGMPAEKGRWMFVVLGFIINICLGSVYAYSVFRGPVAKLLNMSATEAGLPFMVFLALFATGLLGWKAKQRLELASTHRLVARVALILLCITLAVGVITRLSH